MLNQVLEALSDLPVTVIALTAGQVRQNRLSNNVYIADYLPGTEAAKRSQLVICNGG